MKRETHEVSEKTLARYRIGVLTCATRADRMSENYTVALTFLLHNYECDGSGARLS